jgi:predicted DNA-binding protein YlxM (UPF0122 family)
MKDKPWRYIASENIDRIIDTATIHNPEDDMIAKIDDEIQIDSLIDVHSLMEKLPPKYKKIIWEYYFDGKTLEAMGIDREVTKQYMHQELKKAISILKSIIWLLDFYNKGTVANVLKCTGGNDAKANKLYK